MTALSCKIDPLARALAPLVRDMLLDEVRRHAEGERKAGIDQVEAEIMQACVAVARASDRLMTARFSGAPEAAAHRTLIKATANLSTVLRKYGRLPKGTM